MSEGKEKGEEVEGGGKDLEMHGIDGIYPIIHYL